MRKVTKILIGFVLSLFLCVSSFAQNKIAVVDTNAFYDEKSGIIDLISVNKKVREELKDKLDSDYKEIQKLINELEEIRNRPKVGCPSTELIEEKIKKLDQLQSSFKLKINEANIEFTNREKPINERITAKLEIFKKNKGYLIILDQSKMESSFFIYEEDSSIDITKEFIKFCNEEFEKEKHKNREK